MSQIKNVAFISFFLFLLCTVWMNTARAENGVSASALAGSWIVDAGPNQIKTVTSYTPLGGNKFAAVESVFNFDWSLGGLRAVFSAVRPLVGSGSWHPIRQNSAPEWWQPSSKGT